MANPNQPRDARGRFSKSAGVASSFEKKKEIIREKEHLLNMEDQHDRVQAKLLEHLAVEGTLKSQRDRLKWERKRLDLEEGLSASVSQVRNAREEVRRARGR